MTAAPLVKGESSSSFRVMYRRFDREQRAWDAPVCLARGTHPRVVVSPEGAPFITWVSDGQILLAHLAGARAVPASVQASRPNAFGAYPSLAAARSGTLWVTWQQAEHDDRTQIYLARVAASPRD